jgi:hypothetical protein
MGEGLVDVGMNGGRGLRGAVRFGTSLWKAAKIAKATRHSEFAIFARP